MLRSISLLMAGLAIGLVSGIYLVTSGPGIDTQVDERAADHAMQLSADPDAAEYDASDLHTTGIASHRQRLDFYQRTAIASAAELNAMIGEVAASPDSPARRFAAEILLSRYAEISPPDALAASRMLRLGPALTASVYAAWARSDRDAALAAITGEADSGIAKSAGLLLVEELGGDSSALLDVLDALPAHVDGLGFQIEVLVAQSVYDAASAISSATKFVQPADRERAMRRIARKLALADPRQAISAGAQIADKGNRLTFQAEAMREWAAADPSDVLDYLAATDMSGSDLQKIASSTFSILAMADPERLMAIADQWSGPVAERARYVAIAQWAQHEPQRAAEFVNELPPGQQRDGLLSSVARGYGKTDVEAALAWANSLVPKPRGVVRAVIDGVAEEDASRAFDLALGLSSEADQMQALQGVLMRSAYGDQDPEIIANRILALQSDVLRKSSLSMLGYTWAREDPAAVLGWLSANSAEMPKDAFRAVARQIAEDNPQLAAEYLHQVPLAARADWMRQVASGFAKSDPAAAMNWLGQYQGEPGYDGALGIIAQQAAQIDPVAAARNIERYPDANNAAIVARTAGREWARQDPHSAAEWAANIGNEQVRNVAISNVAAQWAGQDAEGAARWALELPAGHARDNALAAAVAGIATQRVPDEKLLSAFSNDMARQQAVVGVVYRLARTDRPAAERLMQKYLQDPTLRSQVEQVLASMMP